MVVGLLLLCGSCLAADGTVKLDIVAATKEAPAMFVIRGLSPSQLAEIERDDKLREQLLKVYVEESDKVSALPPIAGKVVVQSSGVVTFTPKFPFRPGMEYRAELKLGKTVAERFLKLAEPAATKPTTLTAIYPSANKLPENQLRFYLHFSAPMSRGEAYQHLRLVKADGSEVDLPFLEIGEELWDKSGRRLTLLIDPGRIKRGLKPREELGPVLEAGGSYALLVDKGWLDASGRPLAESFTKKFAVAVPQERALDSATWKIEPPRVGTRDPLVIRFPDPLDRGLLERTITIENSGKQNVAGEITLGVEERSFEFRPREPWSKGRHHIVVDKVLEDLAGNRIGVPFEVDELRPVDKQVPIENTTLPFEPRP